MKYLKQEKGVNHEVPETRKKTHVFQSYADNCWFILRLGRLRSFDRRWPRLRVPRRVCGHRRRFRGEESLFSLRRQGLSRPGLLGRYSPPHQAFARRGSHRNHLGVEKEGYATTDTRITVRVFAGWDFKAKEVARPDFIDQGYTRGVPMGGDLSKVPSGKARLLGISKRGDAYLRSLLIHGARALIHQAQPSGGSIKPMGDEAGRTQSWECGRRGPGQQDGAYGLGDVEKHYG